MGNSGARGPRGVGKYLVDLARLQKFWRARLLRTRYPLCEDAVLTVNASGIDDRVIKLNVSVLGVTCAWIVVNREGGREVRYASPRSYEFPAREKGRLDDAGLGDYLKACREQIRANLRNKELDVQLRLIGLMKSEPRASAPALREHRPVMFAKRFPIQFSLPIAPRGKGGRSAGHLDLLVRRGGSKLGVLEVKRPGASRNEVSFALEQAVQYATALRRVMDPPREREAAWAAFGSRRSHHVPKFEAVAVVENSKVNQVALRDAASALDPAQTVTVGALTYEVVGRDLRLNRLEL